MPGLAVQLVQAHIAPRRSRELLFIDFVTQYDASVGVGEYYNYPNLTTQRKNHRRRIRHGDIGAVRPR
jgi:hypothetical protein